MVKGSSPSSVCAAETVQSVAAFVHASCVSCALKIFHADSRVVSMAHTKAAEAAVAALQSTKAWDVHSRCEPNPPLDNGAMALYSRAVREPLATRLELSVAATVLLPRDGMLEAGS